MEKLRCKSGLRRTGTWWYQVNGKFVNKATYITAYYAPDMEKADIEKADIAAMGAVSTPTTVGKPATVGKPTWNYDISPTLLLVVSVVVLVFVMVLLGIMVGDAKISKCGTYQYWGSNGVIWFVEDTCRDIR